MKKMCHLLPPILMLLIACKKDPINQPTSPYWGEISAKKNGITWAASPAAQINSNYVYGTNVSFDSLDQFGILRESCIIYKIPYKTGAYPIVDSDLYKNDTLAGAQFFFLDGDVSLGYYKVITKNNSSFITVASYDTISGEIKGDFDITFAAIHKPSPDAPDSIRLQCSNFHAKVTK